MQRRSVVRIRAGAGALVIALLAAGLGPAAFAAPSAPMSGAGRFGRAFSAPPSGDECLARYGSRCLTPAQLRTAYDLSGLYAGGTTGAGVSIGIVDSFGSPTIRQDVGTYDRRYGLPAIDLQILTPAGAPPAFDRANDDMAGWAGETTLDVEVAHTIAPGAKIVLIETPTSETEGVAGFPDIIKAENAVISAHQVDILSQSFAATEPTFTSPAQIRQLSAQVYPAARAAGVTVLSSSGDSGPTDVMLDEKTPYATPQVDWPASDPLVTAVGGTMLDIGADGTRRASDAAWGGPGAGGASGGGRSSVFGRPTFQSAVAGTVGSHRGIPDIALDASPASGLITFGSYRGRDWEVGGGTSQAAPLMAGIVALADQQARGRVGYLNDVLYGTLTRQRDGGIVDVRRGSNDDERNAAVPGYPASTGYDLATGLGTVDGGLFVPALAAAVAGRTRSLAQATSVAATTPATTPAATTVAAAPTPTPIASSGTPAITAAASPAHRRTHGKGIAEVVIAVLLVAVAVGLTVLGRRRGRS